MTSYKECALALAKEAGHLMRANFQLHAKHTWKEDNSPITETDITINRLVLERIHRLYPEHAVLGEELSDDITGKEYVWVCDPIDGTLPFAFGLPLSTFCLALTYQGESQLGVVYDPYQDRLFFAEKGKGAWLNDQPIHCSTDTSLERTLIDAEGLIEGLPSALKMTGAKTFRLHSNSYACALVAAGEFGAVIYNGNKPWDCAAASILVEEAGGIVTNLHGITEPYTTPLQGALFSNRPLHPALLKLLEPLV